MGRITIPHKNFLRKIEFQVKAAEIGTLFLDYLNSQHPNIKFTHETERKDRISFRDVCVTRIADSLQTSWRNWA